MLGFVALACALAWLDDDAGVRQWSRLRAELGEAQARIAQISARVAEREAAAAQLRDDPLALERAIREELRLAKPGETVLIVPEADAPTPRNP